MDSKSFFMDTVKEKENEVVTPQQVATVLNSEAEEHE